MLEGNYNKHKIPGGWDKVRDNKNTDIWHKSILSVFTVWDTKSPPKIAIF